MEENQTKQLLIEQVVKSITDIDDKVLQAFAFNECMKPAKTRHTTPCIDLVTAVHQAISEDVIVTLTNNPESLEQWNNFHRTLDYYMKYGQANNGSTS